MIIEQDCQIKTNFDFVTHSALMTFDNQTQQFGGKFEMSTYFYSNAIWLDLGSRILTLVHKTYLQGRRKVGKSGVPVVI